MASDTKSGGSKGRAAPKGAEPAPGADLAAPAPPADDEALLGPLWARMAVGAAGVTFVLAIGQFLLSKGTSYNQRGEARVDPAIGFVLVIAMPFLVAAVSSLAADLARGAPRMALTLMTSAASTVSAFLTIAMISAISYFLAPFALVGGPLLRAVLTPPPRGTRRSDHLVQWAFAGIFWPSAIAVGVAFLMRAGILQNAAAKAGLTLSLALSQSLSVALGASILGAILTWTYDVLDPERPVEAADAAEGLARPHEPEERSGGAHD